MLLPRSCEVRPGRLDSPALQCRRRLALALPIMAAAGHASGGRRPGLSDAEKAQREAAALAARAAARAVLDARGAGAYAEQPAATKSAVPLGDNTLQLLAAESRLPGAAPVPHAAPGSGSAPTAADSDLPRGWAAAEDPVSGKTFYYHTVSRATLWSRPPPTEGEQSSPAAGATPVPPVAAPSPAPAAAPKELPPALRARLAARGILPTAGATSSSAAAEGIAADRSSSNAHPAAGASAGAAAAAATAALPAGWWEASMPDGRRYFYTAAGERTWDRPTASSSVGNSTPATAAATPAAPAPAAAAAPVAPLPLPAGWWEASAPDGRKYWYNAAGERTWERPAAPSGAAAAIAPVAGAAAPAPSIDWAAYVATHGMMGGAPRPRATHAAPIMDSSGGGGSGGGGGGWHSRGGGRGGGGGGGGRGGRWRGPESSAADPLDPTGTGGRWSDGLEVEGRSRTGGPPAGGAGGAGGGGGGSGGRALPSPGDILRMNAARAAAGSGASGAGGAGGGGDTAGSTGPAPPPPAKRPRPAA